jgi:hypothetical protein
MNRVGDAHQTSGRSEVMADHALGATDARRMNPDHLEDDEPTPPQAFSA